jgi:hypothetical protein
MSATRRGAEHSTPQLQVHGVTATLSPAPKRSQGLAILMAHNCNATVPYEHCYPFVAPFIAPQIAILSFGPQCCSTGSEQGPQRAPVDAH